MHRSRPATARIARAPRRNRAPPSSDVGAEGAYRRVLVGVVAFGHEHGAAHPFVLTGHRNRLTVVAGARGHHAARAFVRRQRPHQVESAAHLERARWGCGSRASPRYRDRSPRVAAGAASAGSVGSHRNALPRGVDVGQGRMAGRETAPSIIPRNPTASADDPFDGQSESAPSIRSRTETAISGRSVMTPSTPSAKSRSISSAASTTQTSTRAPSRCA